MKRIAQNKVRTEGTPGPCSKATCVTERGELLLFTVNMTNDDLGLRTFSSYLKISRIIDVG